MKKLLLLVTALSLVAVLLAGCAESPAVNQNTQGTRQGTNFRLLISDKINDMADFTSLNATITRIGYHLSGESGGWTEFDVNVPEVNLKELPDLFATPIWQGSLASGNYTNVFIYVSDVQGTLTPEVAAEIGEVNIKVPGGSSRFPEFRGVVGEMTEFVFDITAVRAEKAGNISSNPRLKRADLMWIS
jgi:hypothetical protein